MAIYAVLLRTHIVFGSAALLAGLVALCLAKGSRWHRRVGVGFVVSMLVMGTTGIALAVIDPHLLFIVIGVFAIYLAGSGWRAARRGEGEVGGLERASLTLALAATLAAAAITTWGFARGTNVSGEPPFLYLAFAVYGVIFAWRDARVLRRRGLTGAERIADHLWRMVMGMIFATTALFVANARVLPEPMQKPLVSWAPVALLFAVLAYWLVRVLRGGRDGDEPVYDGPAGAELSVEHDRHLYGATPIPQDDGS